MTSEAISAAFPFESRYVDVLGSKPDFRSTLKCDDPLGVEKRRTFEERHVIGSYGYSQ